MYKCRKYKLQRIAVTIAAILWIVTAVRSFMERSIYAVMLPAAKSGILAGIVLGIGRAIGETMAVVMIAGNQPRMPKGLLKGVRTMTMNIVTDMGYATGLHRQALIATAVVLFVFILIINLSLSLLNRRSENEGGCSNDDRRFYGLYKDEASKT